MPSVPNPIPSDWLQRRLLPTELMPYDQLRLRYEAWSPPRRAEIHEQSGMITTRIDMMTGREITAVAAGSTPDLVYELVADLHEFAEQSEIPLFDHWRPGDELWLFSSPRTAWMAMAGRAGYVWLRNGQNYHAHCTFVS